MRLFDSVWKSTRVDSARKSEMAMGNQDEIVLVGVAGSEVEAGMWNQALRAAGVRALIRPGGPGAGAWASSATFDHQVFVRADQLELAQRVLQGSLVESRLLPRARRSAPRVNRTKSSKSQ